MSTWVRSVYWIKNCVYILGLPLYAAVVHTRSRNARSPRELLALLPRLRFRGYTLRAYQKDVEILGLLDELRSRNCKRLVEIGTARGGTLYLLLFNAPEDATVVSVDLPSGAFGAGYPHWKIPLFRTLPKRGQKLTLLRGDSQSEEMRDRVLHALGGRADFILIDGDHTYEGAKRDFQLYSDILEPGGILAFHDIAPGPPEKVGGVPRLWQELKQQYAHKEFVADWSQGGYGIGILYR